MTISILGSMLSARTGGQNVLSRLCTLTLITVASCSTGIAMAQPANSSAPITLGVIGPFTSLSQRLLAAAVAFDIDFRKNFEPELRQRFGAPIVDVPELDASLANLRVILGTSHSDINMGARLALQWAEGKGDSEASSLEQPVAGVVADLYSHISMQIALITDTFRIPQVAWGPATNIQTALHGGLPYLSRIVPSEALVGGAIWAWARRFGVPAVACIHTDADFPEAIFHAAVAAADAAESANSAYHVDGYVVGVQMAAQMLPQRPYNETAALQALQKVQEQGSRFLVLAMNSLESLGFMAIMEQRGLLYNAVYQLLSGFHTTSRPSLVQPGAPLSPTRGPPMGYQQLVVSSPNSKVHLFQDLWTKMKADDLYGADARSRYGIDEFFVSVEDAWASMLGDEDFEVFAPSRIDAMMAYLFDACYAFVFAANSARKQELAVTGDAIARQLRDSSFDGVSGRVNIRSGSQTGSLQLWNMQPANLSDSEASENQMTYIHAANYEALSGAWTMVPNTTIVWATGDAQTDAPPAQLLECLSGFERSPVTGLCLPCLPGIGCGFNPEVGFPIGIFGPMTSTSQDFLGTAVLFDLDIRKHREPALVDRFGPPLVNISHVHPLLRIKTQLGTTDSKVDIGVRTTLNWFQGIGDAHKVAAIVGPLQSDVTGPVASNAQVFEVPQVAFGGTSDSLSDRTLYPWLLRTKPPASLQSAAMWAWLNHFQVPSAACLYTRESYGEGFYQNILRLAVDAGDSARVTGISFPVMNEEDEDVDLLLKAVRSLREAGKRFILLCSNALNANNVMYAMETEGMLYGAFQILASDGITYIPSQKLAPTLGFPLGWQKYQPVSRGALYPRFLEMWQSLIPEDLYGDDARQRYMLHEFLVLPWEGKRPMLAVDDFQSRNPFFIGAFLFDAAYTVFVAINNLLWAGVNAQDIFGETLLSELKRTSFEGVTGLVSYDDNSDRKGNFNLLAVLEEHGAPLQVMGVWSAVTDGFELSDPSGNIQWVTGVMSNRAPLELTACQPGWQQDDTTGLCAPCPRNWFSFDGTTCFACNAGEIGNFDSAATSCTKCSNGTYRDIQDANCTLCPAGTFSSEAGMSACQACPIGRYAPQAGQPECHLCGAEKASQALFATMTDVMVNGKIEHTYLAGSQSSDNCTCDRGARMDDSGECVQCTEGMLCLGMNDVRVAAGYYAAENELSIFRCIGKGVSERCVGGIAGETCALNRHGITCALCLKDTIPSDDGPCVPCTGADYWPVIVLSVVGGVVLVATVRILDRQNRAIQSHAFLLGTIAIGQFITMMQHLVVLGRLSFDFKDPIKTVLDLAGTFAFDVSIVRLNCLGSYTPVSEFSLKVCFIFVMIVLVTVIHLLYVLVHHQGRFRKHRHSLIGVIGTLLMVFYIAVTAVVLEPVQCLEHPNGKWTMRTQPSVVCWEAGEHPSMLVIGLLAFLAVPVLSLVGAAVVVQQVPSRMRSGDVEFLKAFTFLFFRFRPAQHTYSLIQMVRSFLVALVLAIPDAVVQAFMLESLLLFNYTAILVFWPWRVHEANILDCILCGGTVLIVFLTSFFLEESEKKLGNVAWFSTFVCAGVLSLIPFAITAAIYSRFFRSKKRFQFFLCHHKAGAGAYVRLLKFHLVANPRVVKEVFLDADNLDNLDYLFEYVANHTDMLVVVNTRDIFTRPWCIGEICTARLSKVTTTVVALQGSRLPDEDFIEDFLLHEVERMEMLTECGMSAHLLEVSLRWVRDQPLLEVQPGADDGALTALVERLIAPKVNSGAVARSDFAMPIQSQSSMLSKTLLLYDDSNGEATATAYILRRMLIARFSSSTWLLPEPVENFTPRGSSFLLLVLCTNGIFDSRCFLNMVAAGPVKSFDPTFLPLLGEQGFRFPTTDIRHVDSNSSALSIRDQSTCDTVITLMSSAAAQEWIRALFKEIAITFLAQTASEQELLVAADQVARRLQGLHLKIRKQGSKRVKGTFAEESMRGTFAEDSSLSHDVSEEQPCGVDAAPSGLVPNWNVIDI